MRPPAFVASISFLVPLCFSSLAEAQARPDSFAPATSILGQASFDGDEFFSPPTSRSLDSPEGLAIDAASGKLFVADSENHRILRFSSAQAYRTNGTAEAVFGQPDFVSNAPNRGQPNPAANSLDYPATLAVDAQGRLWVADKNNRRVLRFNNAASKPSLGATADGVIGQVGFASKATLGDPTQPVGFLGPVGVAVDAAGRLWVSDKDLSRILRFDAAASLPNAFVGSANGYLGRFDDDEGEFVPGTSASAFGASLWGLSVAANGTLWVADASNNRVLRFDGAAGKPNGAEADGVLGQADFDSAEDEGPSPTSLSQPYCVLASPDGTLWVGDYNHNRVLGYLAAAAKENGAAADIVLGQPDFDSSGTDVPGIRSTRSPTQIALGAGGSLLVGQFDSAGAVRRWSRPVSLTAPRTARANRAGVAQVRGRASGATLVQYRVPGQGGFKRARGTATAWNFRVAKLKRRTTPVTVRAVAFDGRLASSVVRIAKPPTRKRR